MKVPHLGRLLISNEPHGLFVDSQDEAVSFMELEAKLAVEVPGHDTVPMMLRNEHFKALKTSLFHLSVLERSI